MNLTPATNMHLSAVVVLLVVVVVEAVPNPAFNYAYVIPAQYNNPAARLAGAPSQQQWTQFVERAGPSYSYGYEFPGQVHYEAKDDQRTVKDTFSYVDANGLPVLWQYLSSPSQGFSTIVDTGNPAAAVPSKVDAVAGVYSQQETPGTRLSEVRVQSQGVEVESSEPSLKVTLSPLLKQAAVAGEVLPAGRSPSGAPQFVVSPKVAAEAGGVSELAVRLGAVPVAAVHDVQMRPDFGDARAEDFAPVLIHSEQPKVTVYALEVPYQ
nr:uncharacterized protein LOC128686175 [Cherax quadricarinatus]